MNHRYLFLNSIFFFAIIVSVLAIKHFMPDISQVAENEQNPDSYMVDASYTRINDEGRRDLFMFSPQVFHFTREDTADIHTPTIFVYKEQQNWRITSKTAQSLHGAQTLTLKKDVKIYQAPTANKGSTLLSTQTLSIFPKQNLITTPDFVTIEQPGLKVSGMGLRGDLDSGNISLLSKTRGQYDPQKKD